MPLSLRSLAAGLAAAFVVIVTATGVATTSVQGGRGATAFTTVSYKSGALDIEAYLYLPAGPGPFPLVVYNHGSRAGLERAEQPMQFIGRLLTEAGYAVIVPERRGYGKSGGQTYSEEVGADNGAKMIARLEAEVDDALAAVTYAATVPSIDVKHAAIMGFSFGGIVTVFAASRSTAFVAAVNQASGSLSWNGSAALRTALPEAARKITIPLLCLVAENDATTVAVKSVYEAARANGHASIVVYPPFTPSQNPAGIAPGHLVFTAQGIGVWKDDVLAFLARWTRGK